MDINLPQGGGAAQPLALGTFEAGLRSRSDLARTYCCNRVHALLVKAACIVGVCTRLLALISTFHTPLLEFMDRADGGGGGSRDAANPPGTPAMTDERDDRCVRCPRCYHICVETGRFVRLFNISCRESAHVPQ